MKFWDSSALIPLLVDEAGTTSLEKIGETDREMHVWWAAEVECVSALSRLEREHKPRHTVERAFERLGVLVSKWDEVIPGPAVRDIARRLLRVHPLRATDALQLAAAIVLADQDLSTVEFLCLDERLRDAASREGFEVLP